MKLGKVKNTLIMGMTVLFLILFGIINTNYALLSSREEINSLINKGILTCIFLYIIYLVCLFLSMKSKKKEKDS